MKLLLISTLCFFVLPLFGLDTLEKISSPEELKKKDIPTIRVRAKEKLAPNPPNFLAFDTAPVFPDTDCSALPERYGQPSPFRTCSQIQIEYYINTTVRYPDLARETNIQGTVLASFLVDTLGQVNNIQIMRDPSSSDGNEGVLGTEVRRVIQQMADEKDRWTPATQNGRAVPASVLFPVKFRLR